MIVKQHTTVFTSFIIWVLLLMLDIEMSVDLVVIVTEIHNVSLSSITIITATKHSATASYSILITSTMLRVLMILPVLGAPL